MLHHLPSLLPVLVALAQAVDAEPPWSKLTLVGALVGAILAYQRRWIVPGALYDDLRKQNEQLNAANDQLRRLLHEATGTAAKALEAEPPRNREGG